jgi:diguanylate cyclase (GGDEF)-like protein
MSVKNSGQGLRVLVVDDELVIQHFLQMSLESMGFAVEVFGTLQSITTRCQKADFDLVVVDKNLPDGSGLTLCKELVEKQIDAELVVISGYANLASAVEAIRLGVADYVVKPVDLEDLTLRISRVVDHLKLKRGNRNLLGELQQKNDELAGMVLRDPLTRLFNHSYLQEALQREIALSVRHKRHFSLALIDIDRFKEINNTMGHMTGDEVLQKFGLFLQKGSRSSDLSFRLGQNDIAARYAGDVFSLILPETPKVGAATKLENLRRIFRTLPFEIPGLPAQTISAGVAAFPEDAADREGLVLAADVALSTAKRAGGDQIVSYSYALRGGGEDAEAAETAKIQAFGRMLANQTIKYVYQPIVDISNWSILAYEALCRPADSHYAGIGDLLDTAVRIGRICDLGRVLRYLAIQPLPQLPEPTLLFINLHPQDLNDPVLLEEEAHMAPWARRIVFEITETQKIEDFGRVRDRIKQLRSLGFRVALDDLGSGYSGLNCLALLEPDFVKLDMGLIRGIQTDSRAARLIKHVTEFCDDEKLTTIAEGIETMEEFDVVKKLGIRYMQGFLLARPMPAFCGIAIEPRHG